MCAILAETERNLNSKKSRYNAWLNVVQEVGADFGGCDARLRSAQLAHLHCLAQVVTSSMAPAVVSIPRNTSVPGWP
eukprot:741164-Pyramimonas_sp.AAC.1